MIGSEELRAIYNERFKNPINKWGSEDISYCLRIVTKVAKWLGLKPGNKLKVLDVGCATGFYTKAFYLLGMDAYGLDYSDTAIDKSKRLHPECHFIHMDGFNPSFTEKFDLIFCKGFSGANTHDLEFVSKWTNKYIDLLNSGGHFVFSYTSNFSGHENENEIVNWSKNEIELFIPLINAKCKGVYFYYNYGIISKCYNFFLKMVGKNKKLNFFIVFTK